MSIQITDYLFIVSDHMYSVKYELERTSRLTCDSFIYSSTHFFIHSFMHSVISSFIQSFIHSVHSLHSRNDAVIYSSFVLFAN